MSKRNRIENPAALKGHPINGRVISLFHSGEPADKPDQPNMLCQIPAGNERKIRRVHPKRKYDQKPCVFFRQKTRQQAINIKAPGAAKTQKGFISEFLPKIRG
jgi:hypothetical protein